METRSIEKLANGCNQLRRFKEFLRKHSGIILRGQVYGSTIGQELDQDVTSTVKCEFMKVLDKYIRETEEAIKDKVKS